MWWDSASFSLLAEIPLPYDSDNIRYETATGRVWIGAGSGRDGALIALGPDRNEVLQRIGLRGHPESFQLEQFGARIFVNVPTARAVQVVDRSMGKVVADWSIPARANFPMALDEADHRLFVGTRLPARLPVYDTQNGRSTATLHTVGDADDIFYDAGARRVYVSGGEGFVYVYRQYSADCYALMQKIAARAQRCSSRSGACCSWPFRASVRTQPRCGCSRLPRPVHPTELRKASDATGPPGLAGHP